MKNKQEEILIEQEIFEKTRSINGQKFNSFQRKLIKMLNYALMRQQGCLSIIGYQ